MSGYLGSFIIDDTCTFYANSHTPSTGAAVDADAVPGYNVYEDETGTPIIAAGVMAKLDDAGTTGFYSEQITLSAANGFEAGKSYCIRITIVVGGVTGTQLQTLQIGARVDARLWAGLPTVDLPLIPTVAGRTLDVSTGGEAGLDWANIGSPTTAQNLSATNIDVDQIVASVSGAVGSVTGAVGSVTGAVGSVTGAVGSVAAGGITAASIATGAIDADALAADAATEIRSLASGTSDSGTTTTMVDAARTEADTDYWKDQWIIFTSGNLLGQCRLITGFNAATDTITFAPATTQAAGTHTYEILPAAKVAGVTLVDTLTTYTGNTAQTGDSFARLGAPAAASVSADILAIDNLVDDLESRIGTPSNLGSGATVAANLVDIEGQTDDIGAAGAGLTALATQASVNIIDDFLDTEVAAILAAVDTEVAAIKAKTDNLPAAVKKNTALANFMFKMVLASDHISAGTGLTVTATRSLDGAAFAACANAVTEISAGWYKISLATTDLNGDTVALKFTAATADQRDILIVTQT